MSTVYPKVMVAADLGLRRGLLLIAESTAAKIAIRAAMDTRAAKAVAPTTNNCRTIFMGPNA